MEALAAGNEPWGIFAALFVQTIGTVRSFGRPYDRVASRVECWALPASSACLYFAGVVKFLRTCSRLLLFTQLRLSTRWRDGKTPTSANYTCLVVDHGFLRLFLSAICRFDLGTCRNRFEFRTYDAHMTRVSVGSICDFENGLEAFSPAASNLPPFDGLEIPFPCRECTE